jgi:hypothetical protein
MMTLLDNGWTGNQAQAVLDGLKLRAGRPDWKPEHLHRLEEWCSVREKDPTSIEIQLEFVAFDLLHAYQGIGMILKRTKTIEEARRAIEPYVNLLREYPSYSAEES